ncbi:MAG: tetratricopeptide repeat protein [Bacteroidales bacterium]|nr:tetratricopeptide repeat protein [Bacteroidales bacterium]
MNSINYRLLAILLFLSFQLLANKQVNAHLQMADSLVNTIKEFPVGEQVTKLLAYAKSYQYSNPALCSELVEHAKKVAESANDPMLISNVLNAQAINNFYSGNNREAVPYILQAIEYVNNARMNMPDSIYLIKRLVAMYGNAGNIYQALGEMDLALESLLTSLRLSDTLMAAEPVNISNIATRINILNNMAVLYQGLKKPEMADRLLLEALQLGRDVGVPQALLPTLNNLGLIRIDQEKYEEAIAFYTEALELGRQVADSMGISGNYNNLGLIYEKLGNKNKALSFYLRSLDISRRLGFSIGIANTSANAGRLYSELNMPDSAVYYVKQGIDEAFRSGNDTYLMKNYETLSGIYEKTGAFTKALEMHKKFMNVKDSIFDIEKNRQIEEMTTRFETEKKEKENQLLRKNIEIQQRTSLLLIISLLAFISIALLIYYFYRLKNKALKQQSQINEQEHELHRLEKARIEDQLFAEQEINKLQTEKLEQQNRELSTRILHAINKNEAMNNILSEIGQLQQSGNNAIEGCYGKVSRIVNENISFDKEWNQFKRHFEEVNPGFFYNLHEKYPTLTQSELKLCAYYRINLDTKEIARILNVTNAAIQKGRHRLRKKMNIPSEIDFYDFMSKIA